MEFIKYQRSEWELQKLRIKKIVGHCDAAEPEQYVNTLLMMLEERNSPKAESKLQSAAPVQQLKDSIPLLHDATFSISGDYCSYDDRNSAVRKINAVIAKLESTIN